MTIILTFPDGPPPGWAKGHVMQLIAPRIDTAPTGQIEAELWDGQQGCQVTLDDDDVEAIREAMGRGRDHAMVEWDDRPSRQLAPGHVAKLKLLPAGSKQAPAPPSAPSGGFPLLRKYLGSRRAMARKLIAAARVLLAAKDDDVSEACDIGYHKRCTQDGCECACHKED